MSKDKFVAKNEEKAVELFAEAAKKGDTSLKICSRASL